MVAVEYAGTGRRVWDGNANDLFRGGGRRRSTSAYGMLTFSEVMIGRRAGREHVPRYQPRREMLLSDNTRVSQLHLLIDTERTPATVLSVNHILMVLSLSHIMMLLSVNVVCQKHEGSFERSCLASKRVMKTCCWDDATRGASLDHIVPYC